MTTDFHGLKKWRYRWEAAGFPTIPLEPFSKKPAVDAWQKTPPGDLWRAVGGSSFRGNIGVRTGEGLAVIDCDSQTTTDNVSAGLAGQGLDLPSVITPSGGRHFYLNVSNVPGRFNYKHLSPEIGPGELRAGAGAYLVAPCSIVDGKRYRFRQGSPEKIASLRPIKWRDIAWLLAKTPQTTTRTDLDELTAAPVRLVWRDLPTKAIDLLERLRTAPRDKPLGKYRSRSEAEAAVMAMMILSGWDIFEVQDVFDAWKPAHYWDARDREKYLQISYRKVLKEVASSDVRCEIEQAYQDAGAMPWPGRGGGLDRKTYNAFLAICWQYSAWEIFASQRDLAQHAAASRYGVRNAIKRLEKTSLVEILERGTCQKATKYSVSPPQSNPSIRTHKSHNNHIGHSENGQQGELWARARLGSSAMLVLGVLSERVNSVGELSRETGKAWATVKSALARLQQHGLAELVEDGWTNGKVVADGWRRGCADLGEIAEALEVQKAGLRRRDTFETERRIWDEYHRENCSGCDGTCSPGDAYYLEHKKLQGTLILEK